MKLIGQAVAAVVVLLALLVLVISSGPPGMHEAGGHRVDLGSARALPPAADILGSEQALAPHFDHKRQLQNTTESMDTHVQRSEAERRSRSVAAATSGFLERSLFRV